MPNVLPTASPWGLDWNTLPTELKRDISDRLQPDVRAKMAEVSESWRHAALSASFDRSARRMLAQRENVPPDELPTPFFDGRTGSVVAELQAKGLPHAAMLANLHAICERLPTIDPGRAVYRTLPAITLATSSVFLPPGGEPELLAYDDDRNDTLLVSPEGRQRVPSAITGTRLFQPPLVSVVNSMLSPQFLDAGILLRDGVGDLCLFDSTRDALLDFPDALRIQQESPDFFMAAASRTGRYVAMCHRPLDELLRWRVYDRVSDRMVTETSPSRSAFPPSIAVTDDGTLIVGGSNRYRLPPGQHASAATAMPLPVGFVTTQMAPDDRHVVLHQTGTGVIALEDLRDGHWTTLEPPAHGGDRRNACSIAFAPAMAMAAVMHDDGNLSLYGLLRPRADAQPLQPCLHIPLGQAQRKTHFFHNATAWFDRDGGGVHAAYPLATPPGTPPATGLMHLRFD